MKRKYHILAYFFLLLSMITTHIIAQEGAIDSNSATEEALFAQRILAFWKDHENELVINQIQQFVKQYPDSKYCEELFAILGDAYRQNHHHHNAVAAYETIKKPKLRKKVLNHYLDSLYHLKMWKRSTEVLEEHLAQTAVDIKGAEGQLKTFWLAEAEYHLGTSDSDSAALLHLKKARTSYEKLISTPYQDKALAAITDIYVRTEGPEHGAHAMKALANTHAEEREALLMQVAALQRHYDLGGALSTYSQVQAMRGPMRSQAILNKTTLLYDASHYQDIIVERATLENGLRDIHKPYYNYLLGNAYLWQIDDPDRLAKAEEVLERIVHDFPSFEKMESVEYELATLQLQQKNYERARELFYKFYTKYPETSLKPNTLQNIVVASSHRLEQLQQEGDKTTEALQLLAKDLSLLLENQESLNKHEKEKHQLKLGKVLYELERFDEAKTVLQTVVDASFDETTAAQAHLILGMVAYNGLHDNDAFISHTEKVLAINPKVDGAGKLHLDLFTAYLKRAKEAENVRVSSSKHKQWVNMAADHLYAAIDQGYSEVKKEAMSWLADHYYDQVQTTHNDYEVKVLNKGVAYEHVQRTKKLYAALVGGVADDLEVKGSLIDPADETLLYKLSNTYGWLDESSKQIALLKKLAHAQTKHPNNNWALKARVAFSLGCCLEREGRQEQAEQLFQTLVVAQDSFINSTSKLRLARLILGKISSVNLTMRDPNVLMVLKYLKDLQVSKQLVQEPLHLEAAFEYVALRASLEPRDKQRQHELFLTQRLKEDFTTTEDLWAKDYHTSRHTHPDKEKIYQAFMVFADANIARLQSLEAFKKGAEEEGQLKQQVALSLYRSLIDGAAYKSEFLVANAQKGIQQLTQQ